MASNNNNGKDPLSSKKSFDESEEGDKEFAEEDPHVAETPRMASSKTRVTVSKDKNSKMKVPSLEGENPPVPPPLSEVNRHSSAPMLSTLMEAKTNMGESAIPADLEAAFLGVAPPPPSLKATQSATLPRGGKRHARQSSHDGLGGFKSSHHHRHNRQRSHDGSTLTRKQQHKNSSSHGPSPHERKKSFEVTYFRHVHHYDLPTLDRSTAPNSKQLGKPHAPEGMPTSARHASMLLMPREPLRKPTRPRRTGSGDMQSRTSYARPAPERRSVGKSKSFDHDDRRALVDPKQQVRQLFAHKVIYQRRRLPGTGDAFAPPRFEHTPAERRLLEDALADNFVFRELGDRELQRLIQAFERHSVKAETVILQEGDPADYFYVLEKGEVKFQINRKEIGRCVDGSSFGEVSLLYSCPRAATAVAVTDCELFRVDQTSFRWILRDLNRTFEHDKMKALKGIDFLKPLWDHCNDTDQKRLSSFLEAHVFKAGQILFDLNNDSFSQVVSEEISSKANQSFYLLHEGKVEFTGIELGENNYEDITIGPGQYFGRHAILQELDGRRASKAVCLTDGMVYVADAAMFRSELLEMLEQTGLSAILLRRLLNPSTAPLVIAMKVLSSTLDCEVEQLENLAKHMPKRTLAEGEELVTKGKETEGAIYLVRQGSITLECPADDGTTTHTTKSVQQAFGDDLFFQSAIKAGLPKVSAPYTVRAKSSNTVVSFLTTAVAAQFVDLAEALKHRIASEQQAGFGADEGDKSLLRYEDMDFERLTTDIALKDLKKQKILGEGSFGQVWLVTEPKPEAESGLQPYALKIQSKWHLSEESQVESVVREKQIMQQMNHPFIINLVKTYQDTDFIYTLMEIIPGGELFSIIHDEKWDGGGLPEATAQFYTLCISDAIAYMHEKDYVFRDMKPENVMIDAKGYCITIDFGFARKLVEGKSFTLCGTPLYIPPEMIKQTGHDKSCDHWSIGVIAHELCTGEHPFYWPGMDQMTTFESVCEDDFKDPEVVSEEARDFIRACLDKEPPHRLGSTAGGELDVIRHPWFADLDLRAMRQRKLEAPWVPDLKDGPLDTSHFDDWSELLEDKTTQHFDRVPTRVQQLFKDY